MKECPACGACFPDNLNHCGIDGKALRDSLRGDLVLDGRYKLERRLGHGGMGIVYKATHVFLKSTHAVKVILPDLVGNDPMLGTRFRQEAMVAASIVHRNIVRVTDFGMANREMPYLIMEFLQGKSLYDFLQQRGKLSVKLALEIMEPITAGVGAAHRQTIIHRDLKPLNIFIQEGLPLSEGIKVLDFGLAKIKSEDLLGSFVQARTTNLMGSPHYMAPEQWSEGAPDARADIYSLAVILYEMLAGEPPFNAQSMPEIMKKHLMDRPAPFSMRGVRVSTAIEEAICHALEKDPQKRPASAEAFMTELREALGAEDDGGSTGFEQTMASGATYESAATITGQFVESSMTHEDLSLLETQRKAESEAERLLRELEEAQSRAEEARKRVEEAARKRLEEEEARKRAEAEAARKLAEEEAARQRAEEEARLRAQEEAERKRAEEEAVRRKAEAEARKRAQEEAERQRSLEEANRLTHEVESAQRSAAEARQRAETEAQQRVKEEAARRAAEERAERLALALEEAQSRAEEAGRRVEEATRKSAEQEAARKRAEAEASLKLAEEEAARKRAEEEARLRAEEEAERKFAEETVARQLAEAEARKREEEERRLALEEANRLAREVEAVRLRAEEARQRAETEAQQRAKEEVARKAAEEKADRLARELEEARARAEKARERVEEVASKRAEQEALLRRAEAEAARKRVEEEQASKLVQEEVQQKAEEVARKLAEVDAARKLAEEEARKLAIEEANRLQAQEEANRLAREVEAAQLEVEEAHGRAQKEAEQRTREESARKAAEEKAERLTREVEEARRRVEEQARKHAEEEAERQRADREAKQTRAEAEAQRAAQEEAARKLAGEEAIRFAREVEEAQRRAEAAGQRAEELTRMRAEDEAARRRAEEEALRLAREVEDARRRLEEVRARAEQEALAAAQVQASQPSLRNTFPTPGSTFSEVVGVPPPRRTLPLILTLLAVIFVALPIGGYVIYRATRPSPQQGPNVPANPKTIKADMVQIPGGNFMMGRNLSKKDDPQSPAHSLAVQPFFMDRTEVTNAEYADFVQQTGYSPPEGWSAKRPPAGRENWPVTNVSLDDAEKFAVWRSTRDGVRYRLPKEEEWEYAARGGSEDRLYPWGNEWCDDCANLGTGKGENVDHAEPVGSHPQGANPWGVVDLIGNVWEWTSSPASFYDGTQVPEDQRGLFVARGGSHQSFYPPEVSKRGGKEFPATSRKWVSRDTKSHTLGFRLVRDAS